MQADGSDFGKIFPGAVAARRSHKSNIRDDLGKAVPGLAELNEEVLKKDVDTKIGVSHTLENMLALSCPIQIDEHWETGEVRDSSDWWSFPRHTPPDRSNISASDTIGQAGIALNESAKAESRSIKGLKAGSPVKAVETILTWSHVATG